MYRIYSALIEIVAAAVFIIPIWCIYNKLCFHSWKRTIIYMVFGLYFTAVLALVGFPNIASLKIDFSVNDIPFLNMVSDFINACLNILLFVPFGFFLPILWDKFRNIKNIALMGFIATSLIEISQIFTFRTSDINDIITNTVGSIDVYTSAGYMLRIDCWEAEKDLKTTYGSECALTSLAVDEPLEYARLYLEGNLQMWVDAEDSLELY